MRRGLALLGLAMGCLCAVDAFAAEGDLTLNIFVNYGAAYRDGSWAPVDVFVNNEQRDISGWVEVRTYSLGGELQSPVYRVPADSPKSSKKRFRLHCMLSQCDRVEATLYHGKRPAHDFPSQVNVMPIRKEDFLCLVLDDEPETFGFLSVNLFRGKQNIRFYRESLDTGRLSYLADYPQCYTPFDLIVIGKIDATRVNSEHRELLRQYVERGGTLVICEGRNAMGHRGTWLEPLMGVSLGETSILSGEEIAGHAFASEQQRQGASDEHDGIVVQLTPLNENVKRLGSNPVLATLNPVGTGYVATISIDTATELLQDCVGYQNLWRDLCAKGTQYGKLNFDAAAMQCVNMLPSVAGVEMFPVSSVILYLFLYFFVAIVLNWLVWNFLKRREMAWVCLVIFSVCFTGYAMVYGTQGRARSTELEEIEVVQVPRVRAESGDGEITADLDSLTGLLAAGSGRFDAKLTGMNALVSDISTLGDPYAWSGRPYGYGYGPGGNRPFQFVQDAPPRLQNIRIGASEMRFVHVTSQVGLPGGFEGQVVLDDDGLHGTLVNKTGLPVSHVELLLDGVGIPLERAQEEANGWWVDLNYDQYRQTVESVRNVSDSANIQFAQMRMMRRGPGQFVPAGGNMNAFQTNFRHSILASTVDFYGGPQTRNPKLAPCVVAWASTEPFGALVMEGRTETNIKATLLVAEVEVARSPVSREGGEDLLVMMEREGQSRWYSLSQDLRTMNQSLLSQLAYPAENGTEVSFSAAVRDWMRTTTACDLYVDVWLAPEAGGGSRGTSKFVAELILGSDVDNGEAPELVELEAAHLRLDELGIPDLVVERRTYRIPDWWRYTDGRFSAFRGIVRTRWVREEIEEEEPKPRPELVLSGMSEAEKRDYEERKRQEAERRRAAAERARREAAAQRSRRGGVTDPLLLVGARAVATQADENETTATAEQKPRGAFVAWQ